VHQTNDFLEAMRSNIFMGVVSRPPGIFKLALNSVSKHSTTVLDGRSS